MKLDRLTIRDARTFQGEHHLSLHDSLTVILGKNNAGKSTLLEAMYSVGALKALDRVSALERAPGGSVSVSLSGEVAPSELIKEAPDLPTHFLSLTGASIKKSKLVAAGYDQTGAVSIAAGGHGIAFQRQKVIRTAKNGEWTQMHGRSVGDPGQWQALDTFVRGDPVSRVAAWSHFGVDPHDRPTKRLLGSADEDLRRALVFLRLCHPPQFELLEAELIAAFPEFEQISFVDDRQTDTWEPRFKIRGRDNTNVERKQFGAGTWAFFCILTAAHVAKATAAEFLLLDEPTLYMHPSLERRLLAVLTDAAHWDGLPLRLVAITHSRLWADAAMRDGALQVVDWESQAEVRATIRSAEQAAVNTTASEIVQGIPILFVEGDSDKAALDLLARDLPLACTVVALNIADLFSKKGTLAVLGRTAGDGFGQPTRALFDKDKEAAVKAAEALTHKSECPEIYYAGTRAGQDLESCFCTRDFLGAFIGENMSRVALSEWQGALDVQLADLAAGRKKGDMVVDWLFTVVVLDEKPAKKKAFLSELVAYAQQIRGQTAAAEVWTNLSEVIGALDATKRRPAE